MQCAGKCLQGVLNFRRNSSYTSVGPKQTVAEPFVTSVPPPQTVAEPVVTESGPCIKRLQPANTAQDNEQLTLVAVIVTISQGTSYDRLFSEVPQESNAGTRVSTYTATPASLQYLLSGLRDNQATYPVHSAWRDFHRLLADMRSVEANSVVFNWECCSGCAHETFGEGCPAQEVVLDLMHALISKGHMVMCSDFSLKALMNQWCERRLGPNPFMKLGEFGGSMKIHFDRDVLAECPSAQLQKVGEMCEENYAEIAALPSTIAYTVDKSKLATTAYKLQVLTVSSCMSGIDIAGLPEHLSCEIAGHRGAAGHVLLQYPSGGLLFASAGHWIELTRIGVSERRLLEVATTSYGVEYSSSIRQQFESCATIEARRTLVMRTSIQHVQQTSPCRYSPAVNVSA